jgi:Chaperone for flagella basal body P-ring formation
MIVLSLWTALSVAAGCLSVGSGNITAKDLSRVVPEFTSLPGELSIAFAPLPGARRALTGADIQRIATQYGIETGFRDSVCFEWPMRRLERSDVLRAMRDSLGQEGVELEEFSLFPAPSGQIVFPLTGLNRRAKGSSFWRGYVQYTEDKRFNIWAKLRLDPTVVPATIADVLSGRKVTVLVRSGAAELKLDAQAITSGSKGQTVTIRNPRSGRSFVAQVTGKDTVVVEAVQIQGETQR